MKKKTFCQSCGMPMSKDPLGGGTELDGRQNLTYCSYCYVDGQFTQPDFTVEQMQEFCRQKLREAGCGRFSSWLFTLGIPRLARWKQK